MSNGRSYSPDDWGASGGVNNINLATNIVVNGGGDISPKRSIVNATIISKTFTDSISSR